MIGMLSATILLPFLGAFVLFTLPSLSEKSAARITLGFTWASSAASLWALLLWMMSGGVRLQTPPLDLFSSASYHFILQLSLDVFAAAFLFLVQFTSGMVIRFSRVYLHREPGFSRFFAIVLMFRGAMCLLTLADNLDLLFVGWEMVGLASFLLIAFYHERRQSVRNALKVFSVYRVADVGMLLGAYLSHSSGHTAVGLLLLLAAAGKSAQFPFSFWIVRAMEGPTPSSALFYGALSVHAGAYLLLRTYPLWSAFGTVHICIGVLGLLTAILCTVFSRTQHTIKGQIGYASVTQVGLIFVELAFGLRWLALIHIVANALLRCYQLLVSPSAVAYLLRQQSAIDTARVSDERSFVKRFLPDRLRATLYVFSVSEGYLEVMIRAIFWNPIEYVAQWLLRFKIPIVVLGFGLVISAMAVTHAIGLILAVIAMLFSILALNQCRDTMIPILWVSASYLMIAFSICFISENRHGEVLYMIGILLSCAVAFCSMLWMRSRKAQGNGTLFRDCAFLGTLGVIGFPFLPTFFGEDILLHEVFRWHPVIAVSLSSLFAFNGYVAIRALAFTVYKDPKMASDGSFNRDQKISTLYEPAVDSERLR